MTKYDDRIEAAKSRTDKLIGQRALHIEKEERERRAALAATMDEWLLGLGEDDLTKVFAALELKATVKNRKLIELHPARPAALPKVLPPVEVTTTN